MRSILRREIEYLADAAALKDRRIVRNHLLEVTRAATERVGLVGLDPAHLEFIDMLIDEFCEEEKVLNG